MKKIALCSLMLGLGGINFAFGGCGYEQPRDGSPSDEDIFFTSSKPDYSKGIPNAIICGTQKSVEFCKSGTWMYVVDNHFSTQWGNRKSQVYSCYVSNINQSWNVRYVSELKYLPKCEDLTGFVDVDIPGYDDGKRIVGLPIEGGRAYVNLCWRECEDCKEEPEDNNDGVIIINPGADDTPVVDNTPSDDTPVVTNTDECQSDSDCPNGQKCMIVDGATSLLGGGSMWSDLKAGKCYPAEHVDCFNAAGLGDTAY